MDPKNVGAILKRYSNVIFYSPFTTATTVGLHKFQVIIIGIPTYPGRIIGGAPTDCVSIESRAGSEKNH